jgi:trehalose synthase
VGFKKVNFLPDIQDYIPIVGEDSIQELYALAEGVQGNVIQNINSTSEGGGVAEILTRIIPLLRKLGIDARWDVIKGDESFFRITKSIHNALQGMNVPITKTDLESFLEVNKRNTEEMDFYGDIMFIHDPQPIALIDKRQDTARRKWVWRCHIDLSEPQMNIMDFFKNYIERYDRMVISSPKYARKDLNAKQVIIPPSIDPLSDKNRELPQKMIDSIINRFEIDTDRPMATQISRFDKFKNPCGVIEAYKKVKESTDFQLILAGGGASDDPEGPDILHQITCEVEGDPDIHIIDLPAGSDLEVNALQRASTVVLQNSSREGFGLTVTEALWKAKPVIASAVGGIPMQIIHERSGILIKSPEETEYYLKKVLSDPGYAMRLGENGREHVRRNFLITRHIRDCLRLFGELSNGKTAMKGQ